MHKNIKIKQISLKGHHFLANVYTINLLLFICSGLEIGFSLAEEVTLEMDIVRKKL